MADMKRSIRLSSLMRAVVDRLKANGASIVLIKRKKFESCSQLWCRMVAATRHATLASPASVLSVNQQLVQRMRQPLATPREECAAVVLISRPLGRAPFSMVLSLLDIPGQLASITTALHKLCLQCTEEGEDQCLVCWGESNQQLLSFRCQQCWSLLCYDCIVDMLLLSTAHSSLTCPACRLQRSIVDIMGELLSMPSPSSAGPYAALAKVLPQQEPQIIFILQPDAPERGVFTTVAFLTSQHSVYFPPADVDMANRLLYSERCLVLVGELARFEPNGNNYFAHDSGHAFFCMHGGSVRDMSHVCALLHVFRMACSQLHSNRPLLV